LNVVDASLLSRSLELTLQLTEMQIPIVVCLNMEDEAKRKGIIINPEKLAERLGVPVVTAVASRGVGVKEAAERAMQVAHAKPRVPFSTYSDDVEKVVGELVKELNCASARRIGLAPRLLAIKLLDGDPYFLEQVRGNSLELYQRTEQLKDKLGKIRGSSAEEILSAERHNLAMELFEGVATVGHSTVGLRDKLDILLMHRIFGYVFFAAIMYIFFIVVFRVGSMIETPIMNLFDRSIDMLAQVIPEHGFAFFAVKGIIQGMAGAIGIVFPYLVPFLAGLAVLEDVGYLPRAGYLMDVFMHKMGLHGKSVIPFILGYGCSVPAVMATRILGSKRDRFITAALAVMVPCVARTTIIFGLVGYFLGAHWAFLLYAVNILVIAIIGKVLTRLFPQVTPGLILEIPSYKVPSIRVVFAKVWLRVREFIMIAWPLLIGGSLMLSLFEYARWDYYLNFAFRPVTWALGLPLTLGVTLIFGVFRKELSLIMLFQALGTTQVDTVLSAGQMMTFTLFVMFYIPCVATIAVLAREIGRGKTSLVIGATTMIALVVALLARGIAAMIA